nr:recombinase family protein [bacterium]
MNNLKAKAIALCRVSTKGQMEDGNLAPQEERIRKAAEILNLDIVKIWALAVSSRKGKNVKRKDLIEMYLYCKRYKSIKYLIVDEVDRFMRSIKEYYWWKQEFENIGVQLILANRPDLDTNDDRAVFDELIEVYRAESSNNERINKTPDKMMSKIRAGYYPSNPHTGYKTSDVPGLHTPDEPNWTAMSNSFKAMAAGQIDVKEGLQQATDNGLRTKNYGPKAVGGKTIDMFRWKALMADPY